MLTFVRRGLEAALIVLVLGSVGLAIVSQAASFVGGAVLAVRSESMAPTLAVGDLAAVQRVDPEGIRVGDVITIRLTTGSTVTHRVVAITSTDSGPLFQTRGDANGGADPVAVRADQVVGSLAFTIPLLGFLLAMISMPTGIAAIVSVGAMLLTATWLLDEIEAADKDDEEDELEGIDDLGMPGAQPDIRAVST